MGHFHHEKFPRKILCLFARGIFSYACENVEGKSSYRRCVRLCTHCHSVFRFQTILLCVLYLPMIVFVLPEINTLKNISFACSINGRLSSIALGVLNNGNENNTLPRLVHLCHFLFWLGFWVLSTTPKKCIHVKTLHFWKFGWNIFSKCLQTLQWKHG